MHITIKELLRLSAHSVGFIWQRSRAYLLLTLLQIVLSAAAVFPGMFLLNVSIDLLTRQAPFRRYLWTVGLLLLLMFLLSSVQRLVEIRLTLVKDRFYARIRREISQICLTAEYAEIQKKSFLENKGFALAALGNGSLELLIHSLYQLLRGLLVISGVLYILSQVSLVLLLPTAAALVIDLYNDWLNARQNFVDTKEEVEYSRKSGYLQTISADFSYAKEIRMFSLKERFQQRMDQVDDLLFRLREQRRRRRRPLAILAYGSDTVLDLAIYLYLGYQVLSAAITPGRFSLVANALRQLKNSVSEVLYVLTQWVVNAEYQRGFFAFLEQPIGASDSLPPFCPPAQAEVRFEGVSFRYPEAESDALQDVTLTLSPGETLLVVGENGAGKTTFVKLLCGLYRPTKGRILLNGRDISTIPPEDYQRCISTVFQDHRLFALSLAENICALQPPEEDRLADALQKVHLTQKVAQTPRGPNTQLYRLFDDEGVEFSGGEMQRLAIARAIYKDAPLLAMDEPTSALDPKAEHEIYEGFRRMAQGRTAVYISHRLSSVKFSHRIAVFEHGRMVQLGTHQQLMEQEGPYAQLYRMQADLYKKEGQKP